MKSTILNDPRNPKAGLEALLTPDVFPELNTPSEAKPKQAVGV